MADAPREIRISDCEKLIRQIRDVISVSIVVSDNKDIDEIHVLAENIRNPKQLVRDIETLLRIEYGVDIDHKKVSVVQLNKDQKLFQEKRIQFTSIQYIQTGSKIEAVVELSAEQKTSQGRSTGLNSRNNRLRLFAEATMAAISEFLEKGSSIILEDVAQYSLADRSFVCAAVTYIRGSKEELLLGIAPVRTDEREAVVRAFLSALNRRATAIE